jgi:glutathione S-transferase
VRDLRVRWALEEAGIPYEECLVDLSELRSSGYRAVQPFGQVPAYVEDDLTLFESGAIVQRIAENSEALLPADSHARARAHVWMFAALNSIEPHVANLIELDVFQAGAPWVAERRPVVLERTKSKLADLSEVLKDRDYLEHRFSAGDLLMATVLRIQQRTPLLGEFPVLTAYLARCEARPAFGRALAAQMASYERNAPPVRQSA